MKRVRRIVADNGGRRIKIILKMNQKAEWDKENILDSFENITDEIIGVLLKSYNFTDIKILKRRQ